MNQDLVTIQENILLMDILRYAIVETNLQPFKFTELANWLIDHNLLLRREHEGSKIKKSYFKHKKSNFIQARLDECIFHNFIKRYGTTLSEKSNQQIPLYSFNLYGLLIMDFNSFTISPETINSLKTQGKRLFFENSKSINNERSSESKFYSRMLDKLYETATYKEFLSFSSIFIREVLGYYGINIHSLFFPWMDDNSRGNFRAYFLEDSLYENFLTDCNKYKDLIISLFHNIDAETKSLLHLRLKIMIEEFYQFRYPSTEYEEDRYQNINKTNQILLQSRCQICKNISPLILETEELIKSHFGEIDYSVKYRCKKCGPSENRNDYLSCEIVKYELELPE